MNSRFRVIAICGAKHCGKDTLANWIQATFDYRKIIIAEPLKQVCKILFEFNNHQLDGDQKDVIDSKLGVSPRQVLQFIGTDVMQFKLQELIPSMGRSIWINKVINDQKQPEQRIVISDLRFIHEYEILRHHYDKQLIIIRIENSRVIKDDAHVSENEWKRIPHNYIVFNNGSKEVMYEQMRKIIN